MHKEAQNKVNKAFRTLRKKGFVAHQNFSCCSTCAEDTLASLVKEMTPKRRQKITGVVYYTVQDGEHAEEYGILHLQYGKVILENGTYPPNVMDKDIGKIVQEVFEEVGLEVTWDGKSITPFRVFLGNHPLPHCSLRP